MEQVAFQYLKFGEWDQGISICDKLLSYYSRLTDWWQFTGVRINQHIALEAIKSNRSDEELKDILGTTIHDGSWDVCIRLIEKISEPFHMEVSCDNIFKILKWTSIEWDGVTLSLQAKVQYNLLPLVPKIIITYKFEEEQILMEGEISTNLTIHLKSVFFSTGRLFILPLMKLVKGYLEIGSIRLLIGNSDLEIDFYELALNLLIKNMSFIFKKQKNDHIPLFLSITSKSECSNINLHISDLFSILFFTKKIQTFKDNLIWVSENDKELCLNKRVRALIPFIPYSFGMKSIVTRNFK